MTRIFTLCPFLLFFIAASAQSDLLNAPNISWVAEVYSDYRFNPICLGSEQSKDTYVWNKASVEKMLALPNPAGFSDCIECSSDIFWQLMIYNWLTDYELPAFVEADLKTLADDAFRNTKLKTIDTIATYVVSSQNTDQLSYQLVTSDINYSDIVGARVKQVLYFDTEKQSLGYRALSFAPLWANKDDASGKWNYTPLMWFPLAPAYVTDALWVSDAVSYIVETKSDDQSPEIVGDDMHTVKGAFDFSTYIEQLSTQANSELYDNEGDYNLLSDWEKAGLGSSVDSILTIDPETYESTLKVVVNKPVWENLKRLRLVVRWFFDNRKKQLYYQLNGFAPTVRIYDETGAFRYSYTPFYFKGIY